MKSLVRLIYTALLISFFGAALRAQGEAENGRDAVEKAENLKPDIIILDLIMPVMSGLDAAPLLKRLLPDTLIILFTHQEGSEVERLALRLA